MRRKALYLALALAASPAFSDAGETSLGLGYPYLSARYDLPLLSAEARLVTGGGVQVYAARGYWKFRQERQFTFFTGLEAGYVKFDTLPMKGRGTEFAVFAGGEYAVTRNVSVLLDFAPTLITLKRQTYDVGVSGLEYVVNIGLYYRFGTRGGKSAPPARAPAPQPAASQPPPPPAPATRPAPRRPRRRAPPQQPAAAPAKAVPKAEEQEAQASLRALSDQDWRIRRKAALSLGMLKYGPAVEPLTALLKDQDPKMRGMAALSLGSIGDRLALPALHRALKDGDPTVSKAAADSITRLDGAR